MLLARAHLFGVGPLSDVAFSFVDDDGSPRKMNVLFGGGAVGKSSFCAAIASTRPGYAVAQFGKTRAASPACAVTEWHVGDDEPNRPHALRIASPNAPVDAIRLAMNRLQAEQAEQTEQEIEQGALLMRREQAMFDKKAQEGGFVFVAFPSGRHVAKNAVHLTSPERTLLRYDVRAPLASEDSRLDLAREAKQMLSYASISNALSQRQGAPRESLETSLETSIRAALDESIGALGYTFHGADPRTLEPLFDEHGSGAAAATVPFDDMPTGVRLLVSMITIATKSIACAYPGRDPRQMEAVIVIDDVDDRQDARVRALLPTLLRRALPAAQWIVTTSALDVANACAPEEVLALRRGAESRHVELGVGVDALFH